VLPHHAFVHNPVRLYGLRVKGSGFRVSGSGRAIGALMNIVHQPRTLLVLRLNAGMGTAAERRWFGLWVLGFRCSGFGWSVSGSGSSQGA